MITDEEIDKIEGSKKFPLQFREYLKLCSIVRNDDFVKWYVNIEYNKFCMEFE